MFNSLKNENIKITYLNLTILTITISTMVNALILNVLKLSTIGYVLILLPFLLGGILAGLILDKNKRIVGGLLVGAMAATVSLSIYTAINQTIAGSPYEVGYVLFIIFLIPIFLIAGGIMGLVGSIITSIAEKITNRS